MRSKGSGIGMIMLLVVLAVVLFLVSHSWKAVAPEAVSSGDLPDLNDMRQRTDAHAEEVQAILEQAE
jgi:hypothetical protein